MFRLLTAKKQLEQKQLADYAMVPVRDARELLYRMLRAGFLTLQARTPPPGSPTQSLSASAMPPQQPHPDKARLLCVCVACPDKPTRASSSSGPLTHRQGCCHLWCVHIRLKDATL